MAKSKVKPLLLEYPEGTLPRFSDECARLRWKHPTFKFWMDRAKSFHAEGEFASALAAEAQAYTRHDNDSFLRFAIDILGFKDVYPPLHGQFIPYITGLLPREKHEIVSPYRMGLIFRGSLKSTLENGLGAWRIAQSTVNHDWDECTTRVAMASEKIALAKQNVGAVRSMVDSVLFRERFGRHKPMKRDEGSWGNEMFTSRLQKSLYTRDPTVFTMSLSVDRTGFHCTTILADDLQARSSTYNIEQIEKAYELYRLLHSILDPSTPENFTEMLLMGTAWHYDDVYARIEAESKKEEAKERHNYVPRFQIVKIPAESEVERDYTPEDRKSWIRYEPREGGYSACLVRTSAWPERFPLTKLDHIKSQQGGEIYAAQYLLDPIPQVDRVFLRKDARYRDAATDAKLFSNPHSIIIGGDPAWMSQESVRAREGSSTANSVLIAAAIDPDHNLHVLSIFRQKAAIPEFTEELWRLYFSAYQNVACCALQQYDFRYLAPEFKRKSQETKLYPNFKWLTAGGGKEDRPDKNDRIRAALGGRWSSHKILLPRGFPDAENEFFDFPQAKKKDVLDALTNIVEVMFAPLLSAADEAKKLHSTNIIDSIESGVGLGKNDDSFRNAY